MVLNYIWIGFFVVAFFIALVKVIFLGDTEIFTAIMNATFDSSKERDFENALSPLSLEDFSGQDKVVENLRIFVKAARLRGEALDHVLLHGPPGLGKTTLSNIIANELGVGFKVTSGPVLDKPGDLAGVLTSLEPNDVLFIDEIHRLSPVVEEYLYSAMEDYRIDIMISL